MALPLLWHQVPFGNLKLFLPGIARQLNDLHAVQQGRRDSAAVIGRRNKEYMGQIKRHLDKMVPECAVLFRVQYLQQRRGGISPVIVAQLIYLIQQQYRIGAAGLFDGIDNAARHTAHIGFAVAADLRFIFDAAQGYPCIAPAHCLGNAAHNGGLTHAGRPHKAQDLTVDIRCQRPYRQRLQHPLLYLLQPVMLPIQQTGSLFQVYDVLGVAAPGQFQADLQVSPNHRRFLRIGRHFFQPAYLFQQLFFIFIGGKQPADFFSELILFLQGLIALSQLLTDDPHLLPQVIIPLVFIHRFLYSVLNIRFQRQDLVFRLQQMRNHFQAAAGAVLLQNTLLFLHVKGDVPCYVFRNQRRVIALQNSFHNLFGHPRRKPQILIEQVLDGTYQCVAEGTVGNSACRRVRDHFAHRCLIFLKQVNQFTAVAAFHQHTQRFPLRTHNLAYLRHNAYLVQLIQRRILLILVHLRNQKNFSVGVHCHIQRTQRFFPAYIKMQQHMREQHQTAQGQHRHTHRQCFRTIQIFFHSFLPPFAMVDD